MSKPTENNELQIWAKNSLDTAVHKFIDKEGISSPLVEGRYEWYLPFQILIGKIRSKESFTNFKWFICGEVPTDYIDGAVAESPREAARHFSMQWQLTAARYQGQEINQDPSQISQEDVINNLINQAQALYQVVEDERLWSQEK